MFTATVEELFYLADGVFLNSLGILFAHLHIF